jgi:hypothetical protein
MVIYLVILLLLLLLLLLCPYVTLRNSDFKGSYTCRLPLYWWMIGSQKCEQCRLFEVQYTTTTTTTTTFIGGGGAGRN